MVSCILNILRRCNLYTEKALADYDKVGDIKVGRMTLETTLVDYPVLSTVSYGDSSRSTRLHLQLSCRNKAIGTPIVEDGPTNIITPTWNLQQQKRLSSSTNNFLKRRAGFFEIRHQRCLRQTWGEFNLIDYGVESEPSLQVFLDDAGDNY